MIKVSDLTDNLQPIASEMGVDVAMAIVRHFGGTRLYIPRFWKDDLNINVLGDATARKLCRIFGPERIEVSRQPFLRQAAQRLAREMRASGMQNSAIARQLGLSYRRVTELLSGMLIAPPQKKRAIDARQMDLEDWLNPKS